MSPEELEAAREGANVDYAPDISYDDWQAMAKALLAHINQQAATIENLKAALDESKLDRVNFASAGQEKIEALKEKLVEERAHVLAGRGNLLWEPLPKEDRPDGLYPALTIRGKTYWRNQSRQQLAEEMPEVDWK